jgi:DHA1 family tetracycline resistance protein-like MFS transporter
MQEKPSSLPGKPLLVILSVVLLDLVGFGILIPIVPILLAAPSSPYYVLPTGYPVQQGYILLGWLVAIYPLCQFLAAPILGQLSDKHGRRRVLGVSLAGTCGSYIIFAIAIISKNIPLLFIARGFDGVTGGNLSVAQAAVADITPPKERAKNFGLIGAAYGLGLIIGPYIGGQLSNPSVVSWFTAATPFWFAAVLSAVNIALVIKWLPETLVCVKKELKIQWSRSLIVVAHAYTYRRFRTLFTTTFLVWGGFTFYTTFIGVYLINQFSFTSGDIGELLAYIGLWIVISQGLILRKLTRFTDYKVLRVTLIITGVLVLATFLPTMWWQLLLVAPFLGIGAGLSVAFLMTIVSRSVDQSMQGEILGIYAGVAALAQSIPPIIAGYLAAATVAQAPIYVASLFIVLSGMILWLFYQKQKTSAESG